MGSSNSSVVLLLLYFFFLLPVSTSASAPASASSVDYPHERVGQRVLMSFKETPEGSNRTFDCSPSGPCVPCLYSEKSDEKYRCSETGYRIPFKCAETNDDSETENKQKPGKIRSNLETSFSNKNSGRPRSLLDDSSTSEDGMHAYITYRSCLQTVNGEKLSVLGFEISLVIAFWFPVFYLQATCQLIGYIRNLKLVPRAFSHEIGFKGIIFGLLLVSGSVVFLRRKRTFTLPGVAAGRIQPYSRF